MYEFKKWDYAIVRGFASISPPWQIVRIVSLTSKRFSTSERAKFRVYYGPLDPLRKFVVKADLGRYPGIINIDNLIPATPFNIALFGVDE